jgi:hypothetical protein
MVAFKPGANCVLQGRLLEHFGGVVWESDKDCDSMDSLLRVSEKCLIAWQKDNDG